MKNYLREVYAMHSIYGMAGSLVGIFIPIYLLNLHYSLKEVLFFYLTSSVAVLVFFFIASWMSTRIGLKKIIFLNFPFLFLYIGALYSLGSGTSIALPVVAIILGIQVAFYWFPLHVLFAKHSDEEKMGTNVAKLFAWPQIAGMFGPLIGSFIILLSGFQSLILAGGLIYLLAIIPIIRLPEIPIKINFSFKNFFNLFRRNLKYFFVETVQNMREDAEAIIWPIFVFLAFRQVISVGLIGLFASLGAIAFTFLVGKHADRANKKSLMKISAVVIILVWLARFYFQNEILFYISTLVIGFFSILLTVPFTALIYNLAKSNNVEEFIVFRELPVIFGRVIIYSVALLLVNEISYSFLVLAFSSLFFFIY